MAGPDVSATHDGAPEAAPDTNGNHPQQEMGWSSAPPPPRPLAGEHTAAEHPVAPPPEHSSGATQPASPEQPAQVVWSSTPSSFGEHGSDYSRRDE
jgi:hypothetical protein